MDPLPTITELFPVVEIATWFTVSCGLWFFFYASNRIYLGFKNIANAE